MKTQRIACLSYHKFPGEDWSQEEFAPCQVRLASGEAVTMPLAERGTCLSNGLWCSFAPKTDPGFALKIDPSR